MAKKRCYLCPNILQGEGTPYTFDFSSGAFHKQPIKIEIRLCGECTLFADDYPDALVAILRSRLRD